MSEFVSRPLRLPPAFQLKSYETLGSTMDQARSLAEQGAEDGTLVWAQQQSGGRGRLGRQWVSPKGNLYLSLVLRPQCRATEAAQLGFIAALAIGEAIGSVAPPMDITYKWPNDVLLNGRKVSGILLESRGREMELDYLVLGCGINIASFPKAANYPATSLRFEGLPASVTVEDLLEAFCRYFLSWTNRWLDEGFAPVREAWLRHAARRNEEIDVRLAKETFSGVYRDIDIDGQLVLELPDGQYRRVASGEVFPPDLPN
jgi:BirA family biotin operon repressor/biotin-[acetyl-CoA-carboxylase] ligase|tara:strand:+ start:2185 stop:2961 length:777 start_codon:yes stop_codon:yes gene_type:complete